MVCHQAPWLRLGWHNALSWEGGDLVLHEASVLLLEIRGEVLRGRLVRLSSVFSTALAP